MEEFVPLRGYEDRYQISSQGNIRRKGSAKNLKTQAQGPGYLRIILVTNGKRKAHLVHCLVMETFVGDRQGREVDHLNSIKSDNRLGNLEYVTRAENMYRAFNKNGDIGVRKTRNDTWRADLTRDKKIIHLGTYKTKEAACFVYSIFRKHYDKIHQSEADYIQGRLL